MVSKEETREVLKRIALEVNPKMERGMEKYFAKREEVKPEKIEPLLEFVEKEKENKLFRSACCFWSVPVSSGYGRRIRLLVFDKSNGKLMGIAGLCDPVIALRVRDEYIGWNKEQRFKKLYHVMTAYVLGAVPPYNELLGAKLIALAVRTREVLEYFKSKYTGKKTLIREEEKPAELVLIDTMGAFGKSVIYNRLRGWKFIGFTQGYTHIHLNGLFEEAKEKLKNKEVLKGYGFGKGANWKFRVLLEYFKEQGICREEMLKTPFKRGYYITPLAENFKEFLQGKEEKPIYNIRTFEEEVQYWRLRWLAKRITKT